MITSEQEQRIAEIRERERATTPGPWEVVEIENKMRLPSYQIVKKLRDGVVLPIVKTPKGFVDQKANSRFIVSTSTDIPFLLDIIDALKAENAALEKFVVEGCYANGLCRYCGCLSEAAVFRTAYANTPIGHAPDCIVRQIEEGERDET